MANPLFSDYEELNSVYASAKYDTQGAFLSKAYNFGLATAADFATTVWNSIPFTEEASTYDMLSRIDKDAAAMYSENPEAVQAASFIGGTLVGGGLVLKGMNMLRRGSSAVNWFTEAGRVSHMEKINEAIRGGIATNKARKDLTVGLYKRAMFNNMLDSAAMEGAMLASMNQHIYLEDYWDNPVKNLGIAMGFGVVGAGVGLIAARADVKALSRVAHKDAFTEIFAKKTNDFKAAPSAERLQSAQFNVTSFKNIAKEAADSKDPLQGLKRDLAEQLALREEGKMKTISKSLFSKEVQSLSNEVQGELLSKVAGDIRFSPVDSVDILRLTPAEVEGRSYAGHAKASMFREEPVVPIKKQSGEVEFPTGVYLPQWDAFVPRNAVRHFASAKAIGATAAQLGKDYGTQFAREASDSFSLAVTNTPTPVIDGMYIGALERARLLKDTKGLIVAQNDLPVLNALASKIGDFPEGSQILIQNAARRNSVVPVTSLPGLLLEEKDKLIRELLKRGTALQSIALRTNTPVETIAEMATTKTKLPALIAKNDTIPFTIYGDASKSQAYLDEALAPITVKMNPRKESYRELAAKMDSETLDRANREFVETALLTSPSAIARDLYEYFAPRKEILDMVRYGVAEMSNEGLGTSLINSADFFLRDTGAAGQAIAVIGGDIQRITREHTNRILKPVTDQMARTAANPIAQGEFNTFVVTHASLQGKRAYRNSQLGTITETTKVIDGERQVVEEFTPALFNGQEFTIKTEEAHALIELLGKAGREIYDTAETAGTIIGSRKLADMGYWLPASNPRGKFIAYVIDKDNGSARMLLGNSEDHLKESIAAFRSSIPSAQLDKLDIIQHSQRETYNLIHGRMDPMTMDRADARRFHSGASAQALVPNDISLMEEIVGGLEYSVEKNIRNLAELQMSDILEGLGSISSVNRAYADSQPIGAVARMLKGPKDGANTVRNILLGRTDLDSYEFWEKSNNVFEVWTTYGLNAISSAMRAAVPARFVKRRSAGSLADMDYEAYAVRAKELGAINPWSVGFDDAIAKEMFGKSSILDVSGTSRRAIHASNALASTMALRFGEIAQPLVNQMSLPILTHLAIYDRAPANFLGHQLQVTREPFLASKVMYEGVRYSNSMKATELDKLWESMGYFKGQVSEANALMRQSRSFEGGPAATLEKALDSKFVELASTVADYSEDLSRRTSMYTGYALGKRLYPELDDMGLTIFARNFMDRAIGNYNSVQRPTMFQGTLGVAMGLFQTYMVTMAQQIYRKLELRDYKNLAKAMLLQGGIFGAKSLPGFDMVSNIIGENFSEDHFDLTTGTYRALPNSMADLILYGLPSSLGPAFYSRGDLQPRAANPFTGPQDFVGVDMVRQSYDALSKVGTALMNKDQNAGRAFMEALSLQSVSRPIARLSEFAQGYSITQQGSTVATPAEVWTAQSAIARAMTTRPLEEMKIRESRHLAATYDIADIAERKKAVRDLRTALRNNNLTAEATTRIAEEYLRSGTPSGWRSVLNEAIMMTNLNGKAYMLKHLRPDSPLNFMIDSLDGF